MYFMSDPQALHVTRNVIPGKLGVDLHLHRVHIPLVLVCIHKSYIVYLEIYVVPIVMDFHVLVMEKSWKINVEKEGAPCDPERIEG